jgi:hypothetical protein
MQTFLIIGFAALAAMLGLAAMFIVRRRQDPDPADLLDGADRALIDFYRKPGIEEGE